MAWTKASVDSGQHTYSEALALMQAAGFSKTELDTFLAYNPGDLYRVPEAFDLSTGGVDPMSPGPVAQAPITASSPEYVNPQSIPPVLPGATSGGETSLFLTLGAPSAPSSSMPNRPAANYVGSTAPAGGFSTTVGAATSPLGRIPWILLLVFGAGVWYLSKGGRA